jgi:hypothetical protein
MQSYLQQRISVTFFGWMVWKSVAAQSGVI